MNRITAICLLVLVTSHASLAVILRPSWFPYFRRQYPNPRARDSQGYYGSDRSPEVVGKRQIRNSLLSTTNIQDNPCKAGINIIDCFIRLSHMINHAVEDPEIFSE